MIRPTHAETVLILELFKPLLRDGALLRLEPLEVVTSDSFMKSRVGGPPYIESTEPCLLNQWNVPLKFDFQINTFDLMDLPLPRGLFVAYSDASGALPDKVKYYSHPSGIHFKAQVKSQPAELLVVKDRKAFLPPESLIAMVGNAEIQKLVNHQLQNSWQPLYARLLAESEFGAVLFEDHVGGWHMTYEGEKYMPPRCAECQTDPVLLVQMEFGDFTRSLWSCVKHPSETHYAVHK